MHLADCYALLDIRPGASEEELKRAHRDLTKVWHPDRFAHDPGLRKKAEEKLKAINEAYEILLAAGPQHRQNASEHSDGPGRNSGAVPGSARQQVVRYRTWALTLASLAVFILLRRPTPGGLLLAALLFAGAFAFVMRMRAASRLR